MRCAPAKRFNAFVYKLKDVNEIVLATSIIGNKDTLEAQIEDFQAIILNDSYTVRLASEPDKWKYRFYGLNNAGNAYLLFESIKESGTQESAVKLYETFLANSLTTEVNPIDNEGAFSFQLKNTNQVLAHPTTYSTAADNEALMTEIMPMIRFFIDPDTGESCVQKTARSNDQASHVYRVYKKGMPIAFHPCICFEEENELADFSIKEELERLGEQQYDYLELFLSGGKVIIREEGQYRYVLRDNQSETIYAKSFQTYATKKEAIAAFAAEYLILVHYASDSKSYFNAVQADGTELIVLGKTSENPIAIICETDTDSEILVRRFLTYPIRLKARRLGEKCFEDIINGYYFHLIGDGKNCKEDWLSTKCYDTPAAAQKAFRHFTTLLKYKGNYRPILKAYLEDWRITEKLAIEALNPPKGSPNSEDNEEGISANPENDCCQYITITEVLMESCGAYKDELCAWGKEEVIRPYINESFLNLKTACKRLEGIINNPKADGSVKDNLRVILADDYLYKIVLVNPPTEPTKITLKTFGASTPSKFSHKGLERFLEAACLEDSIIPCIEKGEGKTAQYTFKMVAPESYYFARHPYHYHTTEDRDSMIAWGFQQLQGKEILFLQTQLSDGTNCLKICATLNKNISETDKRDPKQFQIFRINDPNPFDTRWTITEFVNSEPLPEKDTICLLEIVQKLPANQAEAAKLRTCIEVNTKELLKSIDHLLPIGDLAGDKYGFALINPNAELAVHPQKYLYKEALFEAIAQTKAHIHTEGMHLVEHILLRPEEKTNADGATGFDCYCTLLAMPDVDCVLKLSPEDLDPCEQPTTSVGTTGEIGDGDIKVQNPLDYIPGLDPYSFISTAIMPNWSSRYKDANFRAYVTNTFFRETPAHIALNLFWVDPKQLCEFEDQYRLWLLHKAGQATCRGNMPCDLIEVLLKLNNDCPIAIQNNQANCNCEEIIESTEEEMDTPSISFVTANLAVPNRGAQPRSAVIEASAEVVPPERKTNVKSKEGLKQKEAIETVKKETAAKPKRSVIKKEIIKKEEKKVAKKRATTKNIAKKKAVKSPPKSVAKPIIRPFLENIKKIPDEAVKVTKTYAQTVAYGEKLKKGKLTDAVIKTFREKVINFSLRYAIGKKGGGTDQFYMDIMANAFALTLDKLVSQNKKTLQYEGVLKQILEKIKAKGIDLVLFKKVWNGAVLRKKVANAPVILAYEKLIDNVINN